MQYIEEYLKHDVRRARQNYSLILSYGPHSIFYHWECYHFKIIIILLSKIQILQPLVTFRFPSQEQPPARSQPAAVNVSPLLPLWYEWVRPCVSAHSGAMAAASLSTPGYHLLNYSTLDHTFSAAAGLCKLFYTNETTTYYRAYTLNCNLCVLCLMILRSTCSLQP